MNSPKITNKKLVDLASTYWNWKWLWLTTTGIFGVLALFYVLFLKGDVWVASQGLIVRDEATGAVVRLGRFESQTAMKAAQETILEMARNGQVLAEALEKISAETSWLGLFGGSGKPSLAKVEEMARKNISVRAPRGAELGTTEVIYLDVKQPTKSEALELNKAVCDALEKRLKQVRQARANGVISELLAAREAALINLGKATEKLQRMEAEAGVDLSDLRGLTDTVAGGSTTRLTLDTVRKELLAAELEIEQLQVDLATAKDSFDDPTQLLLTPTKLVNTSPGLKKLREGLSQAVIVSSQLEGKFTSTHPKVVASREAEVRLRSQVRAELGNSVETMTKEIEFARERVSKLSAQQASLEIRVAKLAEIRADYANVSAEVNARNEQLQEAEKELAKAEAARDAAQTSSLLTRIDQPIIGENPIGPGRTTILAGATASGLFFGLGVVFLLTPLESGFSYGRRQNDNGNAIGRRAADRVAREVASAPSFANSPIPPGFAPAAAAAPDTTAQESRISRTITEAIREQQSQATHPQVATQQSPLQSAPLNSAAQISPAPPANSFDTLQAPNSPAGIGSSSFQMEANAAPTPLASSPEMQQQSIDTAQAVIQAALRGSGFSSDEEDTSNKV